MLPFLKNKNLAIDLGNNNTLFTDEKEILFSQPSFIVFDTENHQVQAVGNEAFSVFEKNHSQLKPVKPLQWGVIADYNSASIMISKMVQQVHSKKWFGGFDHLLSGIPYYATEVERRALRDVLDQFPSRNKHLIFEPLAAAIGMDLDIREPEGKMVIDIGGGITEIVVISLSGVAVFRSTKVAGDTFTTEIQDWFRRNYNLMIGWKTAEQIKLQIGSAMPMLTDEPPPLRVRGKDIMEGIPTVREISYAEVAAMLDKSIRSIEDSIVQALEACPPELSADIYQNGIYLTGGSALLRGLKERLEKNIQLKVHRDAESLVSVGKGISRVLREPEKFRPVLFN
ncbi:MAG: rod shape-determining protein [Bacteroidetes bacterium]|nr:rod shape-determining protein [Bacteroidota bacterium]